jgi:hypothetical protein
MKVFKHAAGKRKKPPMFPLGASSELYARRRPTLPVGYRLVPSALEDLTTVFGMGTGGAPPLRSPGNLCRRANTRRLLTFEWDKLIYRKTEGYNTFL